MNNIAEIEAWMHAEIAPQAQVMDSNASALFQAFKQLGDRHLLAPRLPIHQGGLGWDELAYSQFQILIASYSGALAFLSTQHHSAVRMIGNSANQVFKETHLPSLITGERGIGVGFSQLRRPGPPMMSAIPIDDGYLLSGTVPWVTGQGCFDGFICGASLPTGEILMGWVPLISPNSGSSLRVSQPLALAAMESTQTIEVALNKWHLHSNQVIAVHDAEWLTRKDKGNTLFHGFYALGVAQGAIKLLTDYQQRSLRDQTSHQAIAFIQEDYQCCKAQMLGLLPHRQQHPETCIQAKAEAIHLAGRCAQAAIAISGGGANDKDHPAQRIYREVLAFTVFGQTPAAKTATLSTLSSYRPWKNLDRQSLTPISEA